MLSPVFRWASRKKPILNHRPFARKFRSIDESPGKDWFSVPRVQALLSLPRRSSNNRSTMFYFESSVPGYIVYMGEDKFENEKLIEWGWKSDIWCGLTLPPPPPPSVADDARWPRTPPAADLPPTTVASSPHTDVTMAASPRSVATDHDLSARSDH